MSTPEFITETIQTNLAWFILVAWTIEKEDFALRDGQKILEVVQKMTPEQVLALLAMWTTPAGRSNILGYNPNKAKELVQAYKAITLAKI